MNSIDSGVSMDNMTPSTRQCLQHGDVEGSGNDSSGTGATPPDTRAVSPVSVDTVHVSLWVNFECWERVEAVLEKAKREAQAGGELADDIDDAETYGELDPYDRIPDYDARQENTATPGKINVNGYQLAVSPNGAGGRGRPYYAYKMTGGGVHMLFRAPTPRNKIPNVRIEMGSVPLAQCGGEEGLWEIIKKILEAMGGTVEKNVLSRIDLYTDVSGVPVGEFCQRFNDEWRVCRGRRRAGYGNGGEDDDERWERHGLGRKETGFVLGTGKHLRVYDKLHEMRNDPLKQQVFGERYGGTLPSVLTRVEFQLNREAISTLSIGPDGARIDTIEDLPKYRNAIWDYLTAKDETGWFRLTDGPVDAENRHQDRAKTWDVWAMVSRANESENRPSDASNETSDEASTEPPTERLAVRVVKRVGPLNVHQAQAQALSLLAKCAVNSGMNVSNALDLAAYARTMVLDAGDNAMRKLIRRHRDELMERVQDWTSAGRPVENEH